MYGLLVQAGMCLQRGTLYHTRTIELCLMTDEQIRESFSQKIAGENGKEREMPPEVSAG